MAAQYLASWVYFFSLQRKVKTILPYFHHLRQSIQEWTKYNFWNTAFKNLKGYGLFKQTISLQIF